jgi:spore germination protein KB
MVSKEMELKNLTPVLADGLMPVVKGTYRQLLFFGETIVMAMFLPYLNIPQRARRSTIIAVIITGLLGICVIIGTIAVFGAITAHLKFPTLSLARYISIGNFIERAEALIILMWIGGGFVKITIFHYCAVLALAQWLNLKDYRPLAIPIGVILVILSIILWENIVEVVELIKKTLPVPFLIIEAGIPAVLLIVAMVRRKGDKG